jgi:NAD(P)-dependent dehydrogenase (short-subunit alcohol dehydrogenase family)
MDRLKDKVAIVYGGGPNMGGTFAHFMAREGAKVVITDVKEEAATEVVEFLKSRNYDATAIQGDAVEEDDVIRIVAKTVEKYGKLDCIVNSAGKIHWSPIVDMELEGWRTCLYSYPTAAMLTTKHAAKAMIAKGTKGSIIHILATAAFTGEASGAAYTAAKAACLNLARSAAMDLAHEGIRVNTITPCGMEHMLWTKTIEEMDPNYVQPKTRSYYSRDDYIKMIPLERFPRASDLAWAAVFLASDESSFCTAIDIPVDGGLRYKYPVWRPGDHTGVNIRDYANSIRRTRYGEENEKLVGP